ncbi:MAG TPA: DUF309 domain-containing protein [Pirellulales bacterium]|jgi:hypothetical protein
MQDRQAANHVPRFLPDEPLPPYTYVSRVTPHPTRDPAGHSYKATHARPEPLATETWRSSREFLFGIDLFNAGYYWEAHEAWESLWHACGRQGTTAELLQGLIKLAAAGVKAREHRPAGVARHARRAAELFASARGQLAEPVYCGLNVDELIDEATRLTSRELTVGEYDRDTPVRPILGFTLWPR